MKTHACILAAVLVAMGGAPVAATSARELALQERMLVQYGAGPGGWRDSGPGSGTGTGRGAGPGEIECRVERIPGSGLGPQKLCYRCWNFVVPGSGQGPQRRCERI